MKVTYIYHSAYLVETKDRYLLFDYVKGGLPPMNGEKMLTVFVSHAHEDHFDPVIFRLAEILGHNPEKIQYVLSYNLERKIRVMHLEEIIAPVKTQISYLRFGATLSLDGLEIEALKSTDQGVAFLVKADGKWLFHSGDLYEWVWEEDEKSVRNDMRARYRREIDGLKSRFIWAAFVPLDPHLQEHYGDGFTYFVKNVSAGYVFPMHMWDRYEIQEQWMREQGAQEQGAQKQGAQKQGAQKQGTQEQGAQKQGAQKQGAQKQGVRVFGSTILHVTKAGQEWELPD